MDLEAAVLKTLAASLDPKNQPILWLAGRSPFIGECAKHAAIDPVWAQEAKANWWAEKHHPDDISGFPSYAVDRFQFVNDGIRENPYTDTRAGWHSNWYCCGCGISVMYHG